MYRTNLYSQPLDKQAACDKIHLMAKAEQKQQILQNGAIEWEDPTVEGWHGQPHSTSGLPERTSKQEFLTLAGKAGIAVEQRINVQSRTSRIYGRTPADPMPVFIGNTRLLRSDVPERLAVHLSCVSSKAIANAKWRAKRTPCGDMCSIVSKQAHFFELLGANCKTEHDF